MKRIAGLTVMLLGLFAGGAGTMAQQAKPMTKLTAPPTIALALDEQLTGEEKTFVSAAEAMPAEKYSFAPTNGEFDGVRTFAMEVKHVATTNFGFFGAILGQAPPPGVSLTGAWNGPDDLQTKEQIVKYLKDSFALGHKAIATITAENAVTPLKDQIFSPASHLNSRLSLASLACEHASDHYGQMVEYLRMNGIVPPSSQGRPPANPSK